MKTRVEIEPLLIQVNGSLAVGNGFRRGLIQRTVDRDADGLVYIPASSLKGRVRRACEQVARQLKLYVCAAPRPGGMCTAHKTPCLVCRTFGGPGLPGNLRWRDARLVEKYRNLFNQDLSGFGNLTGLETQTYARTQVQLSRALGTAAPDHLFTAEFALEDLRFESAITGWLEVTPIADDSSTGGYELLLLLVGLQLVNTLGGGASRGIGWVNIELPDTVTIGEQHISWRKVVEQNLEFFELLQESEQEAKHG